MDEKYEILSFKVGTDIFLCACICIYTSYFGYSTTNMNHILEDPYISGQLICSLTLLWLIIYRMICKMSVTSGHFVFE